MPFQGVRVNGLRDLERAFARFGAAEKEMLTASLSAAAEPVRARSEELASSEIENIGPRWQRMRIGVTTKLVYVAPKSRRGRNPNLARPNLAPLLDHSMTEALTQETPTVIGLLDEALGSLGDIWAA